MTEQEMQAVSGGVRVSREGERGFTLLQVVIAVVVIAVATTFAVMAIADTKRHTRISNSARELASYLEKARTDAIRRHDTATVVTGGFGTDTYTVTMDFDNDG